MYRTSPRFTQMLEIRDITPEAVMERLSYRLRRMIGSGRRWSYYGVASRTQIDVRTLKAYVQGTACPNLVKYKRLLAILGPEIGIELNIMKGWLPRSDVVPPEALDLGELREELLRATDILADVLRPSGPQTDSPSPKARAERMLAEEQGEAPEIADADDVVDTLPEFRTPLKIEDIDVEAVATRLGYRLRRIIGPGRRWDFADVAEATETDRRTLHAYLDGTACPNLARYHRLGHLLGPEVGVELAYMIGWEPRFGHSLPLPRDDVARLFESLQAAGAAIDHFLLTRPSDGSTSRLIRRDDRIQGTRQSDDEDDAAATPTSIAETLEDHRVSRDR